MLFAFKNKLLNNQNLQKELYKSTLNNTDFIIEFFSVSFKDTIVVSLKSNKLTLQNTNFVESYEVKYTGDIVNDIINIPAKVYYFWNNIDAKTLRSMK